MFAVDKQIKHKSPSEKHGQSTVEYLLFFAVALVVLVAFIVNQNSLPRAVNASFNASIDLMNDVGAEIFY